METRVEASNYIQVLQYVLQGSCTDDHQLPVLAFGCLRSFFYQHEKGLEDRVAEARADVDELQQTFNVVENDQREWRLVGVIENLGDRLQFGELGEANELLG